MIKRKDEVRDRRARVTEMQAQQRRAERARSMAIIGSAVAVSLILVGAAAVPIVREQQRQAAVKSAAARPIDGIKEYPKLTRNHVTTTMKYPQTPPVGGDHAPVWTNCGIYTSAVAPMEAVHSLEHGAVWISYQPDLPAEQVAALTKIAQPNSYVLLSPVDKTASPVVATAWGKQLTLPNATDPRLASFVKKYQQDPKAPEPGAACTGGNGGMG